MSFHFCGDRFTLLPLHCLHFLRGRWAYFVILQRNESAFPNEFIEVLFCFFWKSGFTIWEISLEGLITAYVDEKVWPRAPPLWGIGDNIILARILVSFDKWDQDPWLIYHYIVDLELLPFKQFSYLCERYDALWFMISTDQLKITT